MEMKWNMFMEIEWDVFMQFEWDEKPEDALDAFHNWVQGVFALFLSLSADALFTSIFGSTLVSTPHAFHKSSL